MTKSLTHTEIVKGLNSLPRDELIDCINKTLEDYDTEDLVDMLLILNKQYKPRVLRRYKDDQSTC